MDTITGKTDVTVFGGIGNSRNHNRVPLSDRSNLTSNQMKSLSTVAKIAKQFSVAKITIYRKINRYLETNLMVSQVKLHEERQSKDSCESCDEKNENQSPNRILNDIEEAVLESTVINQMNLDMSVRSTEIKRICYEYYCQENGGSKKIDQLDFERKMATDDWYFDFISRHKAIVEAHRQLLIRTLYTAATSLDGSEPSETSGSENMDEASETEQDSSEQDDESSESDYEDEIRHPTRRPTKRLRRHFSRMRTIRRRQIYSTIRRDQFGKFTPKKMN